MSGGSTSLLLDASKITETNFILYALAFGWKELLDKAAKGRKLPDDLLSEISSLLTDRDSCMNAITGSHDIRRKVISSGGRSKITKDYCLKELYGIIVMRNI